MTPERLSKLFPLLREHSRARSRERFPECEYWHPRRWTLCIAGEVGELVNAVKHEWLSNPDAPAAIASEGADVLIYIDLLLMRTNQGLLSSTTTSQIWRTPASPLGPPSDDLLAHLVLDAARLVCFRFAHEPMLATQWTSIVKHTCELMQRFGLSPALEIVRKFDAKSAKVGYEPRLAKLLEVQTR